MMFGLPEQCHHTPTSNAQAIFLSKRLNREIIFIINRQYFSLLLFSLFLDESRPSESVAEFRTPCRPGDKLRKFATEHRRRRRRDGRRRYRSPRVFLNAPTVYICFGSERMGRVDMRRACTHRGYCINGSASRRARRHVMREVTPWPPRRRERQLLCCGEAISKPAISCGCAFNLPAPLCASPKTRKNAPATRLHGRRDSARGHVIVGRKVIAGRGRFQPRCVRLNGTVST